MVSESELFEIADIVAYLGGILGLFFGCTLLTLAEFIFFGFDLILIGIHRLFNKNEKRIPQRPSFKNNQPRRNSNKVLPTPASGFSLNPHEPPLPSYTNV